MSETTPESALKTNNAENAPKTYQEWIQKDSWHLQIIQDTFALGVDAPLRLIHESGPQQAWEVLSAGFDKAKAAMTLEEWVDQMVNYLKSEDPPNSEKTHWTDNFDEWQSVMKAAGDALWMTLPSNSFHLLDLFHRNDEWRFWETIWTAYRLTKLISEETETIELGSDAIIIDNFLSLSQVHAVVKRTALKKSIILLGPVFCPLEKQFTGGKFLNEDLVEPLIRKFHRIINPGKSFKPSDELLTMTGNTRLPVPHEILKLHAKHIGTAIKHLISIKGLNLEYIMHYENASIAEWLLFFSQLRHVENDEQQSELGHRIWCRFDHPEVGEFDHPEVGDKSKKSKWLVAHLRPEPGTHSVKLERVSIELIWDKNGDEFFKSNKNETKLSIILAQKEENKESKTIKSIVNQYEKFSNRNRIFSLKNDRIARMTSIYQEWLRQEDFYLKTDADEKKLDNEFSMEILLKWLLEDQHADAASIYRYDHSKDILNFIGMKYKDEINNKDVIKKYMKNLGKDIEQRKISICYRVVDTGKQDRCKNIVKKEENDGVPPKMADSPTGYPEMKSGIATPIMVHDRVWGILEINGIRPHQFRWTDIMTLSQLSLLFSTFLYQGWFRGRLHRLNRTIIKSKFDQQKEINDAYDKICEYLADIFMSHGCSLWIQEFESSGIYKCKGIHKRHDLINIRKYSPMQLQFNISSSDIHFKLRDTENHFEQYPSLKAILNFDCIKIQDKTDDKLNHLTAIPVKSEKNGELIAFVALYNKTGNSYWNNYNYSWGMLFKYVMPHLAVLLKTINEQLENERIQRGLIEHEIKNNVSLIYRCCENITEIMNEDVMLQNCIKECKKGSHLELLMQDILLLAPDVGNAIKLLAEGKISAALRSGNHPLIIEAEETLNKDSKEFMSIRKSFNKCFNSNSLRSDLKVEFRGLPEDLLIQIQPKNLRKILLNLASNANKYASPNSVIKGALFSGSYIYELRISNEGPMIPDEEVDRLTQRGFRTRHAREGDTQGEGMGLYIVKEICQLYQIDFQYQVNSINNISALYEFKMKFDKGMARVNEPQRNEGDE